MPSTLQTLGSILNIGGRGNILRNLKVRKQFILDFILSRNKKNPKYFSKDTLVCVCVCVCEYVLCARGRHMCELVVFTTC